jgi:hypothetical protein
MLLMPRTVRTQSRLLGSDHLSHPIWISAPVSVSIRSTVVLGAFSIQRPYVANLNLTPQWDAQGMTPNWHLEYPAHKVYGALVPIAADAPLSAAWWHNAPVAFEQNDATSQQYWLYRGKSAIRIPACAAGSSCPAELICDLHAGQSSDACSNVSFAIKRFERGRGDDGQYRGPNRFA